MASHSEKTHPPITTQRKKKKKTVPKFSSEPGIFDAPQTSPQPPTAPALKMSREGERLTNWDQFAELGNATP